MKRKRTSVVFDGVELPRMRKVNGLICRVDSPYQVGQRSRGTPGILSHPRAQHSTAELENMHLKEMINKLTCEITAKDKRISELRNLNDDLIDKFEKKIDNLVVDRKELQEDNDYLRDKNLFVSQTIKSFKKDMKRVQNILKRMGSDAKKFNYISIPDEFYQV